MRLHKSSAINEMAQKTSPKGAGHGDNKHRLGRNALREVIYSNKKSRKSSFWEELPAFFLGQKKYYSSADLLRV